MPEQTDLDRYVANKHPPQPYARLTAAIWLLLHVAVIIVAAVSIGALLVLRFQHLDMTSTRFLVTYWWLMVPATLPALFLGRHKGRH
jgi:hypothetical protein